MLLAGDVLHFGLVENRELHLVADDICPNTDKPSQPRYALLKLIRYVSAKAFYP
jgi:hypothetical protein